MDNTRRGGTHISRRKNEFSLRMGNFSTGIELEGSSSGSGVGVDAGELCPTETGTKKNSVLMSKRL